MDALGLEKIHLSRIFRVNFMTRRDSSERLVDQSGKTGVFGDARQRRLVVPANVPNFRGKIVRNAVVALIGQTCRASNGIGEWPVGLAGNYCRIHFAMLGSHR